MKNQLTSKFEQKYFVKLLAYRQPCSENTSRKFHKYVFRQCRMKIEEKQTKPY